MKRHLANLALAAAWIITATGIFAMDESEGIANRRGNASPSTSESHINNYTYQDEQINLGPNDEDVLVLRTDQKNLMNRYITRTYPLKHVQPREIRQLFRELTAKEGGRAEVIRDKIKNENFLQVVAPKWQADFIEEIVPVLDQPWLMDVNDGAERLYYRAKHRDVRDLDRIAKNFAGEGYTAFDDENNAAVRYDEPYRAKEWFRGATMVDVPEHQARFRVKVYELNVNNDLKIGLDYIAWKNGPGRNLFNFVLAGYKGTEDYRGASSVYTPFDPRTLAGDASRQSVRHLNYTRYASFNYLLTAAYVDFLASKGKAKVLLEGVQQVRSGGVADFAALDQILTFNATPVDPGPNGTVPTRVSDAGAGDAGDSGDISIHERRLNYSRTGEVGVFVEIEPVILKESVELDIVVLVNSVTGLTPQGLPIISSSETVTSARMADGKGLVLSGLTRTEKIQSKAGMPFLGSLPYVGWLFGGETTVSREKEILITIECETETGGESRLANPPAIQTIEQQIKGDVELPKNRFGFDMWLLDEASGSEL